MRSWTFGFVAVLALAGSARAIVLPFIEEVPIPASVLSGPGGDATLANYRSYDLKVTIPQGDQFLVAGLYTTLLPGAFYSPVGGGTTPVLNATAAMLYDTYVTIPLFNPATPTNPFFASPGRYTPNPGTAIMPVAGGQTSTVDIVWGALGGSGTAGTYTIARLTISNNATGAVSGEIRTRVFLTQGVPIDTSFFYGTVIENGLFRPIAIPEPVGAGLVAGGLALLRRRR